jgi:hypothetical protein
MKIESQQDVDAVNGKFNHFHDGFIKRIHVTSDNEFLTDMPWETPRKFACNEEELQAASLGLPDTTTVELDIHHYNYDWPNQPLRRSIIIRATSAQLSDGLLSFIGDDIFDIILVKDRDIISCEITHHAENAGRVRTMENGNKTVLFSAPQMGIEETEWAEQIAGP